MDSRNQEPSEDTQTDGGRIPAEVPADTVDLDRLQQRIAALPELDPAAAADESAEIAELLGRALDEEEL